MKIKRKTKKIIMFLFAIIMISLGIYWVTGETTETISVTFLDENLYQNMKNKNNDHIVSSDNNTYTLEFRTQDIPNITSLNLSNCGINNLSGIENFTGLTTLDLSTNSISDISVLSNLVNLTTLKLNDNQYINNLSPLANLKSITVLQANNNSIRNIQPLGNLTELKELELANNNITDAKIISKLTNLEVLNLSGNKNISNLQDFIVYGLKSLNLSETGITNIEAITSFANLTYLNLGNNSINDMSPLFRQEESQDGSSIILKNIETLDLRSTVSVGFGDLANFTKLKTLYLQNNNITDIWGILELNNLEYINLDGNSISDLSGVVTIEDNEGTEIVTDRLTATQISLKNNEIYDIKYLKYLDLTYLDLSGNHISDISPLDGFHFSSGSLNLRNQAISCDVYNSRVKDYQYIILPDIMQKAKKEGSAIYASNANFSVNGVTLNSEEIYNQSPYYNVKIPCNREEENNLEITINNGLAAGTKLTFYMSDYGDAIESLIFDDANLETFMYQYLKDNTEKEVFIKANHIININRYAVESIDKLNISNNNITSISGMENFNGLRNLNLANNNISDDSKIKALTNLEILNLANNKLNDSYDCIENLYGLTNLNISGNNVTNLKCLDTLLTNIEKEYQEKVLKELTISNNNISDINVLSKIPTLEILSMQFNNISNIKALENITTLKTLNMSNNGITDISDLGKLTALENLYMDNNSITNIEVIQNFSLNKLAISGNKISDISVLNGQGSLTDLYMNSNNISDVQAIENLLLKNILEVKSQKLTYTLSGQEAGKVAIPLPSIFTASKTSTSKVYTETSPKLTNCTLSTDGKSIVVDVDSLDEKIATIEIVGGRADGTTLSVAEKLNGRITYTPAKPTDNGKVKDNVVAEISFNRSNVTITNNQGNNKYTFTQNGEFAFEYVDENGFYGSEIAKVDWIDKQGPQAQVQYSTTDLTKDGVTVTITSDKPIQDISGWEFTNAEKTQITKLFTENTTNTTVTLTDALGNTSEVQIKIENIDKTPPVIQGVETGKTYNIAVTPSITDENLSIVTLKKDGTVVKEYKNGDSISKNGEYELQAVDAAGNSITITFKIEMTVDDEIGSNKYTIDDNNKFINKVLPNTNLSSFKNNITSEAAYKVVDKNGKELVNTEKVTTGSKVITQTGKEYVLSVMGDLNGDGEISISDLSILSKIVVGSKQLEGAYKIAADVTGDNQIKITDLSKLAKIQVGLLKFE